MRKFAKK